MHNVMFYAAVLVISFMTVKTMPTLRRGDCGSHVAGHDEYNNP